MSRRRNVVANYLGQGWTTLIGLVFIPLYIQLLGLEAYGLIGIFALLQSWLSLLDLGLTPTIAREMARFTGGGHDAQSIHDLLRSVEIATFGLALLVSAGIWLSSGWLASEWLHAEAVPVDAVAQALAIMGVVVGLRFIEGIYRSSTIGLQQQVTLNLFMSLMATARAAGAVAVLVWVSPTVTAFFLWQGLVSAVGVVVLAVLVHRLLPAASRAPRFSLEPLMHVWRFAAGTLLLTLLGFLLSQSGLVILSSLLSLSAFGLYSIAHAVASAVRLLAQPIDQAVFPRLTQLHQMGDQAALSGVYHKSAQLTAVLMGGVGLFLAVFGGEVLALWMQDAALAAEAYAVLWILVLGMVLNGIMNGPYFLQMSAGWTGLLVKVNAALVVVYLPVIYLLTLRLGVTGAAVAWVLLNVAYLFTVVPLMHRRLLIGEMQEWYVKDLVLPLLAGAATAIALRSLMPVADGTLATLVFLGISWVGILTASALAAEQVRGELTSRVRLAFGKAS